MSTETREDRARLEELRRLLPTPPEQDLAHGTDVRLRAALLHAIDTAAPTGASTPAVRPRVTRPRALPVMAAVTGIALAVALVLSVVADERGRLDAGPGGVASPGAVRLLDKVAAVAAGHDAGMTVRDDQFVYVRSLVRTNTGRFGGPPVLGRPHQRRVWLPQAAALSGDARGLIRELGHDIPIGSAGGESTAGVDRPTYAWFASLPTDPDVLLQQLSDQVEAAEGQEQDQAVFDAIGNLLRESVVPPATAAALYRATARIPGVTLVPRATDVAGRRGIGIVREDTAYHVRSEWIFDPISYAYLGNRSSFVDVGGSTAVFDEAAVLDRGVVDRMGQAPARP